MNFPHADQRGGGPAAWRDPAAAEGKGAAAAAAEAEVGGVPGPGSGQAEVEALLGLRGESLECFWSTGNLQIVQSVRFQYSTVYNGPSDQ